MSGENSKWRSRSAGERIRVLLVDDHALLRAGLRIVLEGDSEIEVCAEADGVAQARRSIGTHTPDIAVVDLELKDGNGLELIKWIAREYPDTRIVVTTMHDESVYGARALRAGANAFVNKQLPSSVMLDAIRAVRAGRLFYSDHLIHEVLVRTRTPHGADPLSPIEALSDRELEVFRLIGQGRTTRQIAAAMHLSPSTVDTYRGRIKQKLEIGTNAELSAHAARFVQPALGI